MTQREDEFLFDEERQRRIRAGRMQRRRRRRRQQLIARAVCIAAFLLLLLITALIIKKAARRQETEDAVLPDKIKYIAESPQFAVELLTPNEYSRPQTPLEQINGIVIHYTANPGTTAEQNRSYFESLSETAETYASSHFVIGIEGETIQCIPCNEIAYASNERNADTISIECCIEDESGKFSDATYESLIELTAWLMGRYGLTADAVIRHYDVTGKNCPKYYVENGAAWEQLKEDLLMYIDTYGIEKTTEIN